MSLDMKILSKAVVTSPASVVEIQRLNWGQSMLQRWGITLFSQIDRYTLEDAKVELFYHLKLADGSYKKIPMGIFEANEANRLA